MYTNGLKDRYGSPLLSLDVGDERYVMMNQIEFSHAKIEEKIESFGKHVEKNRDDIIDLKNKNYNTNVVLNAHRKNEEEHFTEGEKEKFDNLFVRLDGVEEFTKETIPLSETTGDNGGEAFRMSALMLPVGQVIDEIIVPTKNTPTSSFYLGVYKILSTESNDSTNKTLVAISDEAITWTNGGEAIWSFDDTPFEIPVGFDLEIHIATTKEDLTATGTNYRANGVNELKCRYKNNATGYGACRYQTGWYGNRAIRAIFKRKGIQGHIGDDTHLTPDEKTEVQNLVNDVYLTVEDAANTYSTIVSVENTIEDLNDLRKDFEGEKHQTTSDETATSSAEWNAVHLKSEYLPHDFSIGKVIIAADNTNTDTPLYLAAWTIINGTKTFVGLSDEAITWEEGKDAIWRFNNTPINVPADNNLELYLCSGENELDFSKNEANAPGKYIKNKYNPNGRGTMRHNGTWSGNRCVQVTFLSIDGHIGDKTHLTEEQRTALDEVISDTFVTKEEFDSLVEQTKQKHQYYDTWTNLKDGDINDKANAYSFQLDKTDFVTGRIDRIEIPYVKGENANGYLCVQFFNSSNSVVETHYSLNKQKQDKTGNNEVGLCEYEFATFETPSDYSFVRFSMVENNSVVPTGNSGITFRIRPIKRNNSFTWNTNTNTKINNTGTRWTILLSVLTRKTGKNIGITIRQYDWTPDVFSPINVTLSTAGNVFVAPTNGWIISKSAQTTSGDNSLTLNGVEIAKSSGTAQADVQILIRKGEFITATTAYNLVFYPCKSEQFDYRLEGGHTPYDIWKGAVVYDEYGQPSVKDLYIPDASAWKAEVGSAVTGKIATISGEEALDSNGNLLFNIQSRYIENGGGMFVQSTITSFTSTLDVLSNGTQMFGYSGLTQWNVNLPNLATGDNMFMGCGSLTSFTADLHSLSSGWYFLANCTNLTDVSFVGGLDALTDGTYMFKGCSLNYTSLNNILNALPTRNGNVIEITVADSVKDDMQNDTQWAGVSVPPHHSGSYYEFTHNGWKVRLTSQSGFETENPFDVSEENGYIPDASQWNTNVYNANNLNIVSVVDGVAYDGLV